MSSTLTMEPNSRKKEVLPTGLKWVLQKKYKGTIYDRTMDESDIPYIKALIDAEIEGAQELLDFLEKHESITLNEEF